jgi:guanylate kinase
MAGKLIIFSAPSGAGKSTLIQYLLGQGFDMEFSISATSRAPRGTEQHGVEYYFLSADEFRQKIANQEFLEYEEVYSGCFYGTLRSEVDRITAKGKNIVFDVDVVGGVNIKEFYGDRALSLFIAPPSIEELEKRLIGRGTDTPEMIAKRIGKAEQELSFAPKFDKIVVNNDLEIAKLEATHAIRDFLAE